jgi:alcohol dehydrogenase
MRTIAAILDAEADRPYADSRPLKLDEVDLASPRSGELLIKVNAAGVCHSDLSVIDGNRPRPLPMALGHEAAATVLETGDANDEFAPGDTIVLAFLPACGHCLACSSGESYLCGPGAVANGVGEMLSGGRRLERSGEPVNHHLSQGAQRRASGDRCPLRLRRPHRCRRSRQ